MTKNFWCEHAHLIGTLEYIQSEQFQGLHGPTPASAQVVVCVSRDRVRNSKVWVQIYPDFFTPTPNLWVQEPLSRKSVGAAAPTAPTLTRSLH